MFRVLKLEDHYARVGSAAYTLRQYVSICRLAEQISTLDNDHLADRCACCRIYYAYGVSWHHNDVRDTHVRGSPRFIFPSFVMWRERCPIVPCVFTSGARTVRAKEEEGLRQIRFSLVSAWKFSFNRWTHVSKFSWLRWGKQWFLMASFFPILCVAWQLCNDTRKSNYIMPHVDHLIECVGGSSIS